MHGPWTLNNHLNYMVLLYSLTEYINIVLQKYPTTLRSITYFSRINLPINVFFSKFYHHHVIF